MTRTRIRPTSLLIGVLLGIFGSWLVNGRDTPDVERYRELRDYVRRAYVETLDNNELADRAFHGLAAGLDSHSAYFDAREARALERETAGRYHGLGLVLCRTCGEGRVLYALPGGPAERAGVRVGDRLARVAGEPFESLGEPRFRALVSTPTPSEVALDVVRMDGTTASIVVTTASVVEPSVRHERELGAGTGYVAIGSFSHETPREFFEALGRLRAAGSLRSLIVDLRGNPGGVLSSAVDIARRFIASGIIVATRGRGTSESMDASPELATLAGLPLVILVDGSSASASEVLAGALQEHRAAVLVGEPTYGKGSVQTIHRFEDDGAVVKITTARYLTPSGRRLERLPERGGSLEPDVRVELDETQRDTIHSWLARNEPPPSAIPDLRAWEAREKVVLVESPPQDPQLDIALALLRGDGPGPWTNDNMR